jgi:hypothetical protein
LIVNVVSIYEWTSLKNNFVRVVQGAFIISHVVLDE